MIVRRVAAIVIAVLLSVQVVRNAAVEALAPLHPERAARLWAGHPAVEIGLGLAEIGRASQARRAPDPGAFAMIDDAAVRSPLSPQPFLVRGVQAQTAGERDAATRAFLAAQWRDPRSLPAAYFLANAYFQRGDALHGLQQMGILARLSPGGGAAVAPFVASYARNPANWPQIRALFRSQEELEDQVLTALARDPANTGAVLALADGPHRKPDSPWLGVLLTKLIDSGDYARARSIWASIGGVAGNAGLVFDPDFSKPIPSPPFNWTLGSSNIGLAERQPGGRLHVIFYGSVDGVLASELVLLPPGTYQLQMGLTGAPQHPETMRWSVRCNKSSEPLGVVTVDQAARRPWTFSVPADCPAQWLELSGRSGDIAQQAEVTITNFSVTTARPNA
jgi:hypothetical protein